MQTSSASTRTTQLLPFLLQLALPLAAAARNRNRSQQRALLAHSSSHRGLQAEGVCLALHSPPGQGKPGYQASQPAYRVSSCSPAKPVATPCLLLLGNLAQGQRWCKCPDRSIPRLPTLPPPTTSCNFSRGNRCFSAKRVLHFSRASATSGSSESRARSSAQRFTLLAPYLHILYFALPSLPAFRFRGRRLSEAY